MAMNRAIHLAKEGVIGIVALRNTNHWMRGGTYGWQAAEAGCAAICFTNTEPNMPPWGGSLSKIGNNPLIIAVPDHPNHLVLDMAMSQFSFGKMENLRLTNKKLPLDGGFTTKGELTNDPEKIIASKRALPAGYWKGSGLSIMLDLLVTILSKGNSTSEIGKKKAEYAVSQLFVAIDLESAGRSDFAKGVVENLKSEVHHAESVNENEPVYYPGERTMLLRKENLSNGLPVNKSVWEQIKALKK
jgi:3-dehydro-L-gulonate 2-dehydrogenase